MGIFGGDGFPGGIHAADPGGAVGLGGRDSQALDARAVLVDRVAAADQRAGIVDLVNEVVAPRQAAAVGGEQARLGQEITGGVGQRDADVPFRFVGEQEAVIHRVVVGIHTGLGVVDCIQNIDNRIAAGVSDAGAVDTELAAGGSSAIG